MSGSTSGLFDPKTRHTSEKAAIAGQEGEIVVERDSGNQAVGHADGLPGAIEEPSNVGCTLGAISIQGQNRQRINKTANGFATTPFFSSAEEFETSDRGCPKPFRGDGTRNLRPNRLNSSQVVDENVGIRQDQRQSSRSFLTRLRSLSAFS